jgi:hypothetical protein
LISAVFRQLAEYAPDLAVRYLQNAVELVSSDAILIRCAGLLILQFEFLFTVVHDHFFRCIDLLFDDSVVCYFAAIALQRLVPFCTLEISSDQTIRIFERIANIATSYGDVQLLDILTSFFGDPSRHFSLLPFIPQIASASFDLIEYAIHFESSAFSVSSVFATVLSIIASASPCPECAQPLCEFISSRSFALIAEYSGNPVFSKMMLNSVIEVLCNTVFYSPVPLFELSSSFEFPAILHQSDLMTRENIFILFANIILRQQNELSLETLAASLIQEFGILSCAPFVTAILRVSVGCTPFFHSVFAALLQLWMQDELNLFEEAGDILALVAFYHPDVFTDAAFASLMPAFVRDWIDAIGHRELATILPAVVFFIPDSVALGLLRELLVIPPDKLWTDGCEASELWQIRRVPALPIDLIRTRFTQFTVSLQ